MSSNDPVINEAINLRDKLHECAKEFRMLGKRAKSDTGKELAELDAKVCDDAAAMLQKLGTEVTRLRLGIGHYMDSRTDRAALRRMAETWNGDKKVG